MADRKMLFKRSDIIRAVFAALVCVPAGMAIPHFLTYSPTPSLRHRLFFLPNGKPAEVKKGDIVRFPHQDAMTDNKKVHLLKRVGCEPGHNLAVDAEKNYYCDDDWLGKAKDRSANGVPVVNFVWNGPVPSGTVFTIGDNHLHSYDSRYFGFVPIDRIESKAYPLF